MDKNESYNLIRQIIERRNAGRVEASASDVEEEKKLALANDSDESILDEEAKESFPSPVLVAKLRPQWGRKERKETEEDSLLTKNDLTHLSQELGRPVSFSGVKRSQEEKESFDLTKINIPELLAWAEQKSK